MTSILTYERGVDLLIIAECTKNSADLAAALNSSSNLQGRRFQVDLGFAQRLTIVSGLEQDSVKPVSDALHYSIREYRPNGEAPILVVCAHLPSKRFQSEQSQQSLAFELANAIKSAEERQGHARTILIGDLNMNPFDSGMVAANGLHAVMDRKIAEQIDRSIFGVEHKFFYNPMWSMLGDRKNRPSGTYYYSNSAHVSYFWHTFDQVLLRPSLLKHYNDNGVKVITRIGGTTLRSKKGRPNKSFSDHFPILLNLTIRSEAKNVH